MPQCSACAGCVPTPTVDAANTAIANAPSGVPIPVQLLDVRTGSYVTIQVIF